MGREASWRGVFVITPTPFNADLTLDLPGLQRTLQFSLDCGVHGVVTTAVASESAFLSDCERRQVIDTAVKTCGGKVPVVAGISTPAAPTTIELAKFATDAGADAVMAMPPTVSRATEGEIRDFYKRLAGAIPRPIVIQNWVGIGGTPMPARLVADIMKENPTCTLVKEETEFSSQVITEILSLTSNKALIMGGNSSRQIIEEHLRGVCGTMPATELPEIQVKIWELLEAGKHTEAHEVYKELLPLMIFEIGYGALMFKSVLQRRGIIASAAVRQSGLRPLDAHALSYLDHVLKSVAPLMHPDYPLPP